MFSRRELLLSGVGVLIPVVPDEMDSDAGLVVHNGRGDGRVVLLGARGSEWFAPGALNGIGAPFLGSCDEFREAEPAMLLELRHRYARLWLPGVGRSCRVRTPGGHECFAASWALPALGLGNFIGYDYRDVGTLVRQSATAEFHHVRDSGGQLVLPRRLRSCRAAWMTYFGEGLSLTRLNALARSVEVLLPNSSDFLFATAERRGWSPRVLLTVFD